MINGTPGDYDAAVKNPALFYPINPGSEDDSWKLLFNEGFAKFYNGACGVYTNKS